MLSFDILIPSCGERDPLGSLIASLSEQTIRPERVIILVWKELTVAQLQELAEGIREILDPLGIDLVVQHAQYSDHLPGRGVGYDRHFLVTQAISPYIAMIDEDNVLPPGQLDAWISAYQTLSDDFKKELIVSPTIMRAGEIQSQGVTGISYRFPKYTYGQCGEQSRQQVLFLGANSLFGRTELFQRIQFDPRFVGSYEDIDFTTRARQAGAAIIVLRDVVIDHRERPKTFFQHLFLDTPSQAFYRSRNRILRVRKTARGAQKFAYFLCGLRVQTGGWIWYLFRHRHPKGLSIMRSIMRGIGAGLTMRLR